MKLIRLAILYFHTQEKDWLEKSWIIDINGVEVSSRRIGNAPKIKDDIQRLLIFSSIKLEKLPDLSPDNFLIVPEKERRQAEYAIETIANMLSVANRCQREVASAIPSIAFLPETNDELAFLEVSSGISGRPNAVPNARFAINFNNEFVTSLSDRSDGVALLAEALANKNATGKYHEFVRLYELAFLLPINQVEKKLSQFLLGANLGYTRDEIRKWIQFRHPSTHADLRETQVLVFEADIIRFIPRIEQAAYDLLLNKSNWKSRDIERRNIWNPAVATTSSNDIKLTAGKGAAFQFETFDEFDSYHFDLSAVLSPLPEGFWAKRNS